MSILIKYLYHNHQYQQILVKLLIITLFSSFCFSSSKAQTAKEFYKIGLSAQKVKNYSEAVKSFSACINLKPDYTEAYLERANCNFELKKFEASLPDYVYLQRLNPLNENYIIKCALTYLELKRWADAQNMLMKLESDEINLHIADAKIKMATCKLMLKNFEDALLYLTESTTIFPDNDYIFYFKGIASDSLKDFQTAVLSYTKAIELNELKHLKKNAYSTKNIDSLNSIYLNSLGNAQINLYDFAGAKESYTKALKLDPKNTDILLKRAGVCYQNNELNDALADLKSCEILQLKSYAYYFIKAKVLKKAGQFNLAIENLNFIVSSDTAYFALFLKGQCLESIGKYEDAQLTYKIANKIVPVTSKKELEVALKRIRNRVYELNRENNPPSFSIKSPALDLDKKIMISKSNVYTEIKGIVNDKSLIKSIIINNQEAEFDMDSLNPTFKIKLNLSDKEYLKFVISDIYANTTEQNFEINRLEKNAPNHKLLMNYSEKEKQIYFDKTKSKTIKIIGKIDDESNIKTIMVNNQTASYSLNELNPTFEATIDISRTDSIKILIIDEYDNVSIKNYAINSKESALIADNPMGKTWLIFIANSNYENYSSLSGPEKDLNNVRNALLQYKFDNIISKQNMTLVEMEKFFRIELRDLIKAQGVNSILIWFAGHGKYTNETGYWLPVNAKKDEEITYYPIPYLKSNLNAYGKGLKNVLIVSDACESGPSFSLNNEKMTEFDCKLLDASNNSAYVFSSTTNEKASDNSVFCETFTSILNSNLQSCIPMSTIVNAVSKVVEKRQSQRCIYGKIKDFSINTGSFYFIKREN